MIVNLLPSQCRRCSHLLYYWIISTLAPGLLHLLCPWTGADSQYDHIARVSCPPPDSVSMASLALYFTNLANISQGFRWIPLMIIIVAFIGYSLGLATIPLSLIGELLPSK